MARDTDGSELTSKLLSYLGNLDRNDSKIKTLDQEPLRSSNFERCEPQTVGGLPEK